MPRIHSQTKCKPNVLILFARTPPHTCLFIYNIQAYNQPLSYEACSTQKYDEHICNYLTVKCETI